MRRALTLALALVVCAEPAAAALFEAASVEEAARTADAVVRGTVERRASRKTGDGRIVTDVTVRTASVWRGRAADAVTVTIPGGAVGDEGVWVDAAPVFTDGEEVVLFLGRRGAGWRVNGLALGKWNVNGTQAAPSVPPEELRRSALHAGETPVGEMPVAALEALVRSVR